MNEGVPKIRRSKTVVKYQRKYDKGDKIQKFRNGKRKER